MSRLSDFFQPLNLVTLLYFLFALVFFDIFGTLVKSLFLKKGKVDGETRLTNWLMGLGLFVFIWFVLGFFITPTQLNILISIMILLIVSLPYYLKNHGYLPLVSLIKPLILPVLLIFPFLPAVFVKASLPPYVWDEMAYHFISPYNLMHDLGQFWHFSGGVYGNVPRLMDTFYILGFSITHTYSVVRLVQFSILITSLLLVFLLIKKLSGALSAALFILIFLSLPLDIPSLSTIGYVDVVAMSFLFLGVIFGITFLLADIKDYLVLSLIFWAMSIGTKYTTLISFFAFLVSFTLTYWIKNKSLIKLFDRKILLKIVVGLIIFGGYWYIKNFIVYGNPTYPFLFPCWGQFAPDCKTATSFFGNWTTPVNLHTIYPIIRELIPQNIFLPIVLMVSPLLVFFFGDKRTRLASIMLLLSFGIEIIVLKYFSGFQIRYQQYLIFTLILLITMFASVKFKPLILKFIQLVLIFALVGSCVFCYIRNVKNGISSVTRGEFNYAIGKENIYNWVRTIFPDVSAATIWCENPPNGPVALAYYDPDIIWYSYSGLMRVYLLACHYSNPDLSLEDWKNISVVARERKLKFWTVSVSSCVKPDKVSAKMESGDSSVDSEKSNQILQMRRLNNAIVCNSKEIVPNLYYFDYEKLK